MLYGVTAILAVFAAMGLPMSTAFPAPGQSLLIYTGGARGALGIFLAILGCFGLVSQAGRKKNKPAAAQSTPSAENSDINSNVFEKE